jgi:glycerol transport system ATP-binding protein
MALFFLGFFCGRTMLELLNVSKQVGDGVFIDDVSMTLEEGSLNVLLGPTLSGKTTLMRLMAGLEIPSSGDIRMHGCSVVGRPVQKRNVAMVYQQFINYPTLTVYENIASPLRIAGMDKRSIDKRVGETVELLQLGAFIDRKPLSLSGGQQQRTALARALVKEADLVLLDEPLANLDYKLREELRQELPRLFSEAGSILVYATTEPSEALQLGGNTATLAAGRLTQFGDTLDLYRNPVDLITAQSFSDPPLNTVPVTKYGQILRLEGVYLPFYAVSSFTDGAYRLGIRPYQLYVDRQNDESVELRAQVAAIEITGSESFVHLDYSGFQWVAILKGISSLKVRDEISVYFNPRQAFIFDDRELMVWAGGSTAGSMS